MLVTCQPITKENASELAYKGWKIRKAREAKWKSDSKELALLKEQIASDPEHCSRVMRLEKQLDQIERAMRSQIDSKDLANLSAAYARLFDSWCVLTGTARPSSRKSGRREKLLDIQPVAPDPTPAPPAPQRPMGWEYE